jgi:hypothetical protein
MMRWYCDMCEAKLLPIHGTNPVAYRKLRHPKYVIMIVFKLFNKRTNQKMQITRYVPLLDVDSKKIKYNDVSGDIDINMVQMRYYVSPDLKIKPEFNVYLYNAFIMQKNMVARLDLMMTN